MLAVSSVRLAINSQKLTKKILSIEYRIIKVQETQLSLKNRATHLCKCNGVADLLKPRPSPIRYHAEFASSASKGVCINRTEPPNWAALWPRPLAGAWLTTRNTPDVLSCRIWSFYVKRYHH